MNTYKYRKIQATGRILCLLLLACCFFTSCDDWLDVRGENIEKEQDQFETYKGFRDALTGCYMKMGATDLYGQRMTMTDIECLADLWYPATETDDPAKYYLSKHDYTKDEPLAAFKNIYASAFTVITTANVILKNLEENGGNIADAKARDMIKGEAYAIRAYCQFDLLRLFGQMPQGGTKTVKLPYSYTTAINEMPAYYDYNEYVNRLEQDIQQAENLLKESDPIFGSTFTTLNSPGNKVEDDFKYYRQSRLNYWAVRALHARMALYMGKTTDAHTIAMEIINAKGADGQPLITLSGISDLQNGYNGLPSECLFYLSKYNVNDYANRVLIGGLDMQVRDYYYSITSDMLNELYASIPGATASHNRYLNEWNRLAKDVSSRVAPTLKKYWYDESKNSGSNVLVTKLQIIPMLRLSEMYLIAMETSNSLPEVQSLYDTYMSACSFTLYTPFETLEQAREEMINEYRRELFGEGQMFFTYKRNGANHMLWNNEIIKEDDYIIPLPATEYDPSLIKN